MNIGSANAGDAFYRYKMPRLEAKIEGRGNGIKTNIVNLVDISKCLGRPPQCTSGKPTTRTVGARPPILSLFFSPWRCEESPLFFFCTRLR